MTNSGTKSQGESANDYPDFGLLRSGFDAVEIMHTLGRYGTAMFTKWLGMRGEGRLA